MPWYGYVTPCWNITVDRAYSSRAIYVRSSSPYGLRIIFMECFAYYHGSVVSLTVGLHTTVSFQECMCVTLCICNSNTHYVCSGWPTFSPLLSDNALHNPVFSATKSGPQPNQPTNVIPEDGIIRI
ncbi:hypothetical protein LSH36_18g02001 [Paralvinella palmiformis]|uniref:Uncharacterized protein n=1 Tax=Paralvinella palmiformis TaxID=53620 RepID=A0AAD9KBP8_9ANNE|nr:hypothetical protein LSH36_18g02001 [Paralvinella palmiformis]